MCVTGSHSERILQSVGGPGVSWWEKLPFEDSEWTELRQPRPALLSNTRFKAPWETGDLLSGFRVGAGQASLCRPRVCMSTDPTFGLNSGQHLQILNFWTKGPSHSFCTIPHKLASPKSGLFLGADVVSLADLQTLPSTGMLYMLLFHHSKTIEQDSTNQKLVEHCGNRIFFKLKHYTDNINTNPALEECGGVLKLNSKC